MTGTTDGYLVHPAALDSASQDFTTQTATLDSSASTIRGLTLQASAFGQLPQSAQAAEAHTKAIDGVTTKLDVDRGTTKRYASGLTASAKGYRDLDEQVAAMYKSITPGADATPTGPSGATTGGPFAQAISDNRQKVSDALTQQQAQLAQLQARKQQTGDSSLDSQIADTQSRIALYKNILDTNRQIIGFDPSVNGGAGSITELVGTIDGNTTNVGILVPGTHASIANHQGYVDDVQSLVDMDPNNHTAMIVYSDGRNPQSLIGTPNIGNIFSGSGPLTNGAPDPQYATAMGPDLASFTQQVRAENAAVGNTASVTAIGHSYGASVVGAAEEQPNFSVDKIIDMEGAGVGPGAWSPSAFPDYGQVQRFSMTDPSDPISLVQGQTTILGHTFDSPHGADPDLFPGTTQLSTAGTPTGWLPGPTDYTTHMAVLKPYSPTMFRVFDAMTGQPIPQ